TRNDERVARHGGHSVKRIEMVEVDYDFCSWDYGKSADSTMLHAWELDGDYSDSSGSVDASPVGSPSFTVGKFGQCIYTDTLIFTNKIVNTNWRPSIKQMI